MYVPFFSNDTNTLIRNQQRCYAIRHIERTHSHGFAENAGTSANIVVMFIDETITADPSNNRPPAPAPAATHPAAAKATLSTHALGPNHAGHAAAPPAAGAPNAVDAANGGEGGGGRRHAPMLCLVR